MADRALPTPTCTDHCAGCDRHFHGIRAFDLHRVDFQCFDPHDLVTNKRDGTSDPALQIWTNEGHCTLGAGCRKEGKVVRIDTQVTVWQPYQTPAVAEKLKALRGRG